MPEGNLIAQYGESLSRSIFGSSISSPPRLVNFIRIGDRFPSVNIEELRSCLDQPLLEVTYRGKDLFIILQDGVIMNGQNGIKVVRGHLGMAGKWFVKRFGELAAMTSDDYKNIHFRIDLSYTPGSVQPEISIFYQNERFGQFDILSNRGSFDRAWNNLAPGFLGNEQLTVQEWCRRWTTIKGTRYLRDILMDQTILCSGLGNFLLAEVLWMARLHPDILIYQLNGDEVVHLFNVCQYALRGHFNGSLQKVIYKHSVTPDGRKIEYVERKNRKIWYCPEDQIFR